MAINGGEKEEKPCHVSWCGNRTQSRQAAIWEARKLQRKGKKVQDVRVGGAQSAEEGMLRKGTERRKGKVTFFWITQNNKWTYDRRGLTLSASPLGAAILTRSSTGPH